MKILLITHGTYLRMDRVAVGNSVRAYYLAQGLLANGFEVVYVYPSGLGMPENSDKAPCSGLTVRVYDSKQALSKLITEENPHILLVGYWELLEHLPDDLSIPIILDVVAPRVLEAMYQQDRQLNHEINHMLSLYRKADRFLAGNERQRHFLLPWLIMAGFDCRQNIPVDVVPISTRPGKPKPPDPNKKVWRLVSGGVSWPWRRTENYFSAVAKALRDLPGIDGKLVLFSGQYIYEAEAESHQLDQQFTDWPSEVVEHNELQPYGEMEQFLSEQADIGLELADQNTERCYSQSFRAIEFLRCGLPLICNDYLELAEHVRKYDAGWIIKSLHDIPALLAEITASPALWLSKSENAVRLVTEEFNFLNTIQPVVNFIRQPVDAMPGISLLDGITQERDRLEQERNRLEREKEKLSQEINEAKGMIRELTQSIIDLKQSHSWRITAPLRALSIWIRGAKPVNQEEPWVLGRTKQTLVKMINLILKRKSLPAGEKTIIMITRDDLFPTDHGAAVKIDRTASNLSRLMDSLYLITDNRRYYYQYTNGICTKHCYPVWVRFLAPRRVRVQRQVDRMGIPKDDSFLYFPLSDWSYIVRTIYIAFKYPVTAFQAEFPAYARPCLWGRSLFGGKVLLVEHNVEYLRLKDRYPEMRDSTFRFLRQLEIQLCNQVDEVITVSERDRQQLIDDGVEDHRLHVIPHGVDLETFDKSKPLDLRRKYGIPPEQPILVFHGIYYYYPNVEAMRVMADEILPRLHAKGVYPKVVAIGRLGPGTEGLHDDIIFTDSVAQIEPYLLGADLAVVPLLQGGGTRMKILDYFAARLPVVSTSKGIEGIPVENGVHAIIVDDYERFADAVADLLGNAQKAREIGLRGRAYVENLDWKIIARQYVDLMH